MDTKHRLEILGRFHAEQDPAKREVLGNEYAADDLECLIAQMRS